MFKRRLIPPKSVHFKLSIDQSKKTNTLLPIRTRVPFEMTKCPFTVGQKSVYGHMFVLHHRAPMDTTTVGHDFAVIRGASESPCHEGFLATFRVAKTH